MPKTASLPAEVNDHFAKANVLHTYVEKSLGDATKHALETGQELLAAKAAIPHGSWEEKCGRLFDGSLRTAQFYMTFAKDFGKLKSAEKSALLMLEGTLDGAAKAARKSALPAQPKRASLPKPAPDSGSFDEPEPPTKPDYGKCPNCAGVKWEEDDEGASCVKCRHPHGEPAGDVDGDRITTQRQKTVKITEALQREFDDLHHLLPKPESHTKAVADSKGLLALAKAWK